jgi:exopolysaccharide biosynthesis protein
MWTPTRERRRRTIRRATLAPAALAALIAATLVGPAAETAAGADVHAASIVAGFVADATEQIAVSVTHLTGRIATDRGGGQAVHVLTARAGDPSLTFQASLATGEAVGRATVSAQARSASTDGHRVIAAVNGDVWGGYASETQDAPNGIHIQDGELMVAATDQRVAFGVDASGRATVGPARVQMSLAGADLVPHPVDRLNQLRRAGEVVAYSSRFGPATPHEASGTEVVLGGLVGPLTTGAAITMTVMEIRTAGSMPIGPDQIVLNGPTGTYLDALMIGQPVTLSTTISPGWEGVRQLITGRENILTGGVVAISPRPAMADQLHPRSAIGTTADGSVVIATVDGRQTPYSTGVDLDELAALMLSQGAVNAINLDGGGSTALDVREPGDVEATIVNRPSDGGERAVANAILLVSSTPTGPPSQLVIRPAASTLYVGEKVAFGVKATDAAFNGVPVQVTDAAWSLTAGPGTLSPTGVYTAVEPGEASLTVSAIGLTAQLSVTVQPDAVGPVVGGSPVSRLTAQTTLTSTSVPLTVSWPAATDRGTGVAGYEVQTSADGGTKWKAVKVDAPGKPKALIYVKPGDLARVRVRAIDKAGNAGEWSQGLRFRVIAYQDASSKIAFHGTWKRSASAPLFGGSLRYTLKKGGTATFAFTGSQVAWVSMKGRDRGLASVVIDGKAAATVDVKASAATVRRIVYVKLFTGTGRHEIEITSLGTPGRPRVDLDAILVVVPVSG